MNPQGANRDGKDSSPAEGRAVRRPSIRPAASKGCILLIEDSEEDAIALKRTLRKAGITMPVKIAQDGAAALSYLRGDPAFSDRKRFPLPTIVILDLHLPDKKGFEILQWLRAQPQFNQTFVAALTAAGRIDDIAGAYQFGANSFITTPCRPEDVRNLAQAFPSHWVISPQPDQLRPAAEPPPPGGKD